MISINFKNFISLNISSFLGYLYVSIWIYIDFFVRKDIMLWKGNPYSNLDTIKMAHSSIFIDIIFSFLKFCFIVSFILFVLFLLEYFLRKLKKLPDLKIFNENKIYAFVFYLGLLFHISPIFFVILNFLI